MRLGVAHKEQRRVSRVLVCQEQIERRVVDTRPCLACGVLRGTIFANLLQRSRGVPKDEISDDATCRTATSNKARSAIVM